MTLLEQIEHVLAVLRETAGVDAKMGVNRARTWSTTGDGHGQHVEDKP